MYVQTYFLDGVRAHSCDDPRPVRLSGQPSSWEQQICDAWNDWLDPSNAVYMYVAHPTPVQPMARSGNAAHIILAQSLTEAQRAVVFTVTQENDIVSMAKIITPTLTKTQAFVAVDKRECLRRVPTLSCQAWYLGVALRDDPPLHVVSGMGIMVGIFRVPQGNTVFTAAPSVVSRTQEPPPTQKAKQDVPVWDMFRAAPKQIKLETMIPPSAATPDVIDFKAIPMPHVEHTLNILMNQDYELSRALPKPDDLPWNLQVMIAQLLDCASAEQLTPQSVEIYTDGSKHKISDTQNTAAAWAFVVVFRYSDGRAFLHGWDSARVAVSGEPHVISSNLVQFGQQKVDAFAAESEAIYRALTWCFGSSQIHAGTPVHFVSDAKTLVQAVRRFVTDVLSPIATALGELIEVHWHWQRGHDGCLFNELADHIAFTSVEDADRAPQPHFLCDTFVEQLPWLWMVVAARFRDPGFTFDQGHLQLPRPPPLTGVDVECWPHVTSVATDELVIDITCATYNVNTLKEWVHAPSQTKSWSSRSEILKVQGKHHHLLFLQETRSRASREFCAEFVKAYSRKQEAAGWYAAPDASALDLHAAIVQHFPKAFPSSRKPCTSSWLSDHTWSLLNWSRRNRHAAMKTRKYVQDSVMRQMMQVWLLCAKAKRPDDDHFDVPADRLPHPKWLQSAHDFLDDELRVSMLGQCSALDDLEVRRPLQAWIQSILAGNWSQVKSALWQESCHEAEVPDQATQSWHQHIMARTAIWAADFDKCLHGDWVEQVVPACAEEPVHGSLPRNHVCATCDKSFADAKSLAVRCHMQHGQHAYVRAYMPHPVLCGACNRSFQNSQKLRQHLQWRGNGCLQRLEQVWMPMAAEEIVAVPTFTGPVPSHRQPPQQHYGPDLPTRDQWSAVATTHVLPPLQNRTYEDEGKELLAEWLRFLHAAGSDAVAPPPLMRHLPVRDRHRAVSHVLQQLRSRAAADVPGGLPAGVDPVEPSAPKRCVYQPPHLPSSGDRFFVLYLYSGHMRAGDLVQSLHELGQVFDQPIECIPVDVVFHSSICDLLNPLSQAFWRSLVSNKHFVGLIGSPPCETWSVARWRAVTASDSGPRPVRSAQQPWGLQTCSIREMKQLCVANELLQFWLTLAAIATTLNVAWLMELCLRQHQCGPCRRLQLSRGQELM
eukprot:Skav220897  [mRNA]  locus=scaffold3880:161786:167989:+ [translate_table: standard]